MNSVVQKSKIFLILFNGKFIKEDRNGYLTDALLIVIILKNYCEKNVKRLL